MTTENPLQPVLFEVKRTIVGQDVLLDLRARVFAHVQRLSLAFHERYTSGRVISRLTSDLDSLQEMLDKGLDGFFISVLSLVGIGAMLLVLDVPLGLVALGGFVPLGLLTRWYRRRSQHTYRATRTWIARVIVQFVETMNGIRAVQAFRRERRNSAIMDGLGGEFGGIVTFKSRSPIMSKRIPPRNDFADPSFARPCAKCRLP